MGNFFKELRRRKIWWVTGVYLAVSWVIVQVGTFALPPWLDMVVIIILAVGFPLALILAWAQEAQAAVKSEPEAESPTEGDHLSSTGHGV